MLSPKLGAQLERMKRRSNSGKYHHRWKRKFFAFLLIVICFATFVLMESEYSKIKLPSLISPPLQKPKIAFLFIARNRIPLDIVWDVFFKGDAENRFSIYVHSRPGFLLNTATTRSTLFLNRQVNDSVQVDWGEASMIQAERVLIQNALMDPSNERFLFLSDSCIPLYNFSYTYDYIMSTPTSFVDSFADKKESRYNPKMQPVISVDSWKKGSQWVVLTRKHAGIVVEDETVLSIFQLHCKTRPLPEFWRDRPLPADASAEHNCIPDEHYVQTLLTLRGLEGEITRRSLTHSSWDLSSSRDPKRRGWHPVTYKLADATPNLIQSIRDIDNIYYETEYRREWCTSKGKPSQCFLFARKFTRSAALRLLNISALGFSREDTTGS
ncbi:Core-2/I-branching beta-1 [Perilla frutescens var. hirtella]|uniref:Core-2/I-branching beta-1 n=1 Tax=Perilla frutescens var. hirtella TaxID=608512 RepID=A0AAD4JBQ6_PERFH|nr:Core-2/I-branching beta-1 [Perilla frutescens var. frutescens]KAH6792152.1 Core-2/I-branching beta-1 [Perilla frutescens var. hirtella]KAH6830481.1 Core-2/I-branching beta-1 [Perilla frutescens var. hirtella]